MNGSVTECRKSMNLFEFIGNHESIARASIANCTAVRKIITIFFIRAIANGILKSPLKINIPTAAPLPIRASKNNPEVQTALPEYTLCVFVNCCRYFAATVILIAKSVAANHSLDAAYVNVLGSYDDSGLSHLSHKSADCVSSACEIVKKADSVIA